MGFEADLSSGPGDHNGRPTVFKTTIQEIACVMVVTMAPALASINTSQLIIALPEVAQTFGVEGGDLSWAVSASALGTGSFLLFFGQVADILGRKKVLIAAYFLFSIFSLVAGLMTLGNVGKTRFIGFAVIRAIQGVLAAAAVPSAVGILGSLYKPSRRKNYAMATFAAGAPIGFVSGILACGIASEILNWQSSLYFFAIVFVICAILSYFCVPNDPVLEKQEAQARLRKLDYGGAALAVCGFTLFVFGLSNDGWEPYTIALLVVGLAFIAMFCIYEAFVPALPLMKVQIWLYDGFAVCMAIMFFLWTLFTGVLTYYATLYFQEVKHVSSILTTAYFLPMAIGGVCTNILMAMILHLVPGRIVMVGSSACMTGAALCWSFVNEGTLYWALPFPALVLSVMGADSAYNVGNLHALSTVDSSLQSSAGGLFNTVLQLSTAIGLAASAAVVASKTPNTTTASDHEKMEGYRRAYYFAIGCGGAALLLSLFLKVGVQGKATKETDNEEGNEEED